MKSFRFVDRKTSKVWVETAPDFKTARAKIYKALKIKPNVFTVKAPMNTWVIER